MTGKACESEEGPQRSVKRTRNAITMIERLSNASSLDSDMISNLFPLDELQDDSLQKFSDPTAMASPQRETTSAGGSNIRREKIRLPALHKSIRISGRANVILKVMLSYL